MSLANPAALLWLALAIPIVIFYILKIRLKRVPVSTVLFWRQIFDEKKPRSIWQRLRHLVSLVVQLILLGLLIAALTEPFLSSEALTARRVILVLDNSASMNATDVGPSRLGKAKEEAMAVVQGLRFRDEMAIVTAGTQPRVACGLTGHQRTLREAIDVVPPTDGPTMLADAIAIAKRLAAEKDGGQDTKVVVVTDACVENAAKLAEGDRVSFVTVGGKPANVAITRLQVRRSTIDPIGYEILAEVVNQSDADSGDFRLVLELNGNTIEVEPLKLAPNGVWSRSIEKTTKGGGKLVATLMSRGEDGKDRPLADALAADNTAVALLPKRDDMPVHLHAERGNLFLQKVLEANPLVVLTSSAKELPTDVPAGSVKVFHRQTPAKLPPGNVLVVDPANDCDLWKVGDKLAQPIVTQQDKDSPLMAHVRLDNVLMPEAKKLTFAAGVKPQVLAGVVTGEPVLAVVDRPEGKVVVLTVDLDKGELPFRTAFPILAMNTLGVFAGAAGELRESSAAGATAEVTVPSTGADFVLKSPDGSTRKLPASGTKTTVGPFDAVGVWSVAPAAGGPAAEEFAVNLMSKAESDLRTPDGLPATATAADAGLVGGFLGRPIWWYLLGLAFVLIALEWYLYQRRFIS